MGRMTTRCMILASVLAAGMVVSACSGANVELKGGVFDALGVSGDQNKKRNEPKMANRPGLVIPPSTASLPAPGTAQPTVLAANGEAFPVNPEDAKRLKSADILQRHNTFCEKARQREKIGLAPTIADSPWGSCHQSALRNLTGKDLAGNKAVGAQ